MPVTLVNLKSNAPEDLDESQANDAILSGSHMMNPQQTYAVRDPDGTAYSVSGAELPEVLKAGYTIERPEQKIVREYVKDNAGIKGAAKVALGQFADEALFGLPELIYNRTADPLEVAKKDALKKEHDLANTIGGVAGFAGSMFLPGVSALTKGASKAGEVVAGHLGEKLLASSAGELGSRTAKTMAKEIVSRMAVKSAKLGTENAVLTTPRAITEAALGDPEAAGETLAWGVGLGALFGGGGALAKDLSKLAKQSKSAEFLREKLSSFRPSQEGLREKAGEKAIEALTPNLSQRSRLQALEEVVDETGDVVGLKATQNIDEIGNQLLEQGIYDGLPDKKVIFQRIEDKSSELSNSVVKQLDDVFAKHGDRVLIDRNAIKKTIESELLPRLERDTALKPQLKRLRADLEDLVTVPEGQSSLMTPLEANRQKSSYQDIVKTYGLDAPAYKKIAEEIPKAFNKEIRRVIGAADKGALESLIKTQRLLGNINAVKAISAKSAAREQVNNDFGLTSVIASAGLGSAAASISGDPLDAVMLGGAGLFGRQFLRKYGDQILAKGYSKASGLLFAEKAMKQAAFKVDTIPAMLDDLVKKGPGSMSVVGQRTLNQLVPGERETTRLEKLDDLRDKMSRWAADPQSAADNIATLTAPVSNLGAPEIGRAFNAKMSQAYQYLFDAIPKPQRPRNPFVPEKRYKPSNSEMSAFMEKAQVIQDPWSVLMELGNGTLTRNHMDALKKVFPKIHDMMKVKVHDTVLKSRKPFPYNQRVKLSLLLDIPLDHSLTPEAVQGFQNTYLAAEEEQSQGPQGGADGASRIAESMKSDTQRLMTRRS